LLTCDGILNDESRVKCIEEINLLSGNRIPECEKLPLESKNNTILSSLNKVCYFKMALKNKDISFCDSQLIKNDYDLLWEYPCHTMMAIKYDNKDYCESMKSFDDNYEPNKLQMEKYKSQCKNYVDNCKTNPEFHFYCTLEKGMCELFSKGGAVLCSNI
jgi:hypothetical protein